MNKRILELNYNTLLAVDIETVKQEECFTENSPNFEIWSAKCKDQETGVILQKHDIIKRYDNKASFYPEWGKIVCISVAYIHNENIITKSFVGEESEILLNFTELISAQNRVLAVHNASFDISYIRKRFFVNFKGTKAFPIQYSDSGCKPWEVSNFTFDTMEQWKGIGFFNSSLSEVAMCCGLPSPKEDISGANINDVFYKEKDINRIATYCEKDVATVLNIIRVWKGDSPLETISKTHSVVEEKIDDIFSHLLNGGAFSKNVKSIIINKAKDFSIAEKQSLKTLVLAHYLVKKGNKDVNNKREKEIHDFFAKELNV